MGDYDCIGIGVVDIITTISHDCPVFRQVVIDAVKLDIISAGHHRQQSHKKE